MEKQVTLEEKVKQIADNYLAVVNNYAKRMQAPEFQELASSARDSERYAAEIALGTIFCMAEDPGTGESLYIALAQPDVVAHLVKSAAAAVGRIEAKLTARPEVANDILSRESKYKERERQELQRVLNFLQVPGGK